MYICVALSRCTARKNADTARLTWEARCLDKKLEPVFEAEEMEEAAGWQRDAVASGTQHLEEEEAARQN